jgi:hypothetical protein
MNNTLTLKTPADVLAAVPCILGFHPEDSIVLLTLGDAAAGFHARVDLPSPDEVPGVVDLLGDLVDRNRARRVLLVVYGDDEAIALAVVKSLAGLLQSRGAALVSSIRAHDGRWFCLSGCTDRGCPADGTPYDVSSHPITARSVFDGRVTHGSRRELELSLVGGDSTAVDAVRAAADAHLVRLREAPVGSCSPTSASSSGAAGADRGRLVSEGRWVDERVRRYLREGTALSHDEAARMLAGIAKIEVRDVAWAQMSRRTARRHIDLWRDLLRRSPAELAAAPAALLGFAAWLSGDGALAWCAVERCQEAEPDYSLAGLLAHVLSGAVPPSVWTPMRPDDLELFAG